MPAHQKMNQLFEILSSAKSLCTILSVVTLSARAKGWGRAKSCRPALRKCTCICQLPARNRLRTCGSVLWCDRCSHHSIRDSRVLIGYHVSWPCQVSQDGLDSSERESSPWLRPISQCRIQSTLECTPASLLLFLTLLVPQVLMKRNSTYIAFILAGALLGERVRSLLQVTPLTSLT